MKRLSRKIVAPLAIATMFAFGASGLAMAADQAKKEVKPAAKKVAKVAKVKAKAKAKAKASPRVKAVQAKLIAAGFKVKEDGILGAKTRAAIKAFQKKNGLKATGRITKATLAKMGLK